jgi:uncharacterized protein YnzC (UPF0291/DUF896 family)
MKGKYMSELNLDRINELARKSKAEGLTEEELAEQKELRRVYIEAVRRNLRGQLDNITLVNPDGTTEDLKDKYKEKGH